MQLRHSFFLQNNWTSKRHYKALEVTVNQGSATYGPRTRCGPPKHFPRPATFYCHPARYLCSFFNDRYAAINRQNDSYLLAKTFFVVFTTDSSEKKPEFLAKAFFLWSAGMVAPAGTLLGLNVSHYPVNMHISDQYCLRAVLYCVYRCCLANIETILGLFYKTHISEIRKILLNCFKSQFNFIRHSCLHVLISVLSKNKCYYTILCQNCSILSKQYRITNTEQH